MANGKVDRRQIPFGRTAPERAGLRQIRPVPLRRAHQGAGETGINQLNLSERLSASAGFKELPLGAHRSVCRYARLAIDRAARCAAYPSPKGVQYDVHVMVLPPRAAGGAKRPSTFHNNGCAKFSRCSIRAQQRRVERRQSHRVKRR